MTGYDYYCIIAVRDGGKTISDVILSIIQQSIPPKKIIVVDDGSSDKTGEILDEFSRKYPTIVEIIHTSSKTRDYARIPTLWNLCLRKDYEYCMIGAGDCTFEKCYAEKILNKMRLDNDLVVCSGSNGKANNKTPRGVGRFIKQSFFFSHYEKFPEIVGYEAELLERALMLNYKIQLVANAKFEHLDRLGTGHHFKEFGMGMKSVGYYAPYAYGRCIENFFKNPEMGKKGALQMFWAYIKFKPQNNGYYSLFPKDLRTHTKNRQKGVVKLLLRRPFIIILSYLLSLLKKTSQYEKGKKSKKPSARVLDTVKDS